jgi:hypothetical protein
MEMSSVLPESADERFRVREARLAWRLCTPLGRTTLTSSSSSDEIAALTFPTKSSAQAVSVIQRFTRFIDCEWLLASMSPQRGHH